MGRASAGGSTYSLIPSIDRSDKPSARQAMRCGKGRMNEISNDLSVRIIEMDLSSCIK